MRWPFGPTHMTLKPSKEKQKTTKHEKKKTRKTKKYSKMSFSVISQIFLLFWVGVQNFPFLDNLAQKARTLKHYKNRCFSQRFLRKTYASRNGHFWTKKTKFRNSNYHFFACFLLFQQHKPPKIAETPIFIVF